MSFYNFVYTAPFPKDTKITKAQVFEALRVKTRDPVKFIPAIVGSEVLEETPTSIKRTMTTRDGATITGDIDLYAPSFVTFKGSNGSFVINSIAEDDEGHMSLTFLFSFPIPKDIEPGSEEEAAKKQEFYKLGKEAVHKGVATTLEMFEAGKL
ncbi:hypothetical protein FS749_010036 [Ceratobasidium sp. UAMH 11750]|nr:hypothetical protein FS749_010036 [Ceratobasidium sp. UAMH 11750]